MLRKRQTSTVKREPNQFRIWTVSYTHLESIKLVEFSDGVVISADELEREWRESLSEVKWRANFPHVVCEVKASQVLLDDKSSSLGDNWSQNGPLSFCVPGKARWW